MRQILLSDYYQDFFKAEEEEDRIERESKPKIIFTTAIIIVVFLSVGLLYLGQHVQYAKASYEISSVREAQRKLVNENNQLQVRMQELSSLSRIEKIAKEKLGLVVPKQIKIIPVSYGTK